ncbi:MAG: alkaline phosphatase family protein [Halobacteriales archaeon]
MTKLLVLGIDGADFDILDPLFEQDRMPNLQRLAENGAVGPLKSTIPPSTCPGWQSFYTGKSPGNIGIYGFRNFEWGSYETHIPDSSDLTEGTYWELLGDQGIRTGIVGGPFTYPPQEIEGFMIGGPWTPSDAEEFTYPPALSEELREVCDGEYVFIPDNYVEEEFTEAFDRRTEAATHLVETQDWDVFTLVYRPDPLQHVYWDKDDEVVFRIYEYMDRCIGEVLDLVDELEEDINVMVMSDHGFEGLRTRYFHVNQWLEDEGYLTTTSDASTSAIKYLPLETGLNIASKLGVLDFIKHHFVPHEVKEAVSNPLHTIKWSETRAFFIWEQQTGQIYVNTEDRFAEGTVVPDRREEVAQDIRKQLRPITDPEGRDVIEESWLGSELYDGTYEEIAPDVVFTLHREYKGQGTFGDLFTTLDTDRAEGGHHVDGVFFASGPDFQDGDVDDAEIIDLAPTILHLMDAPVEEGMDGEVLTGVYADDSPVEDREIEYTKREGGERRTANWEEDQKEEVEGRLEDLGYL